jgi:putative transposase
MLKAIKVRLYPNKEQEIYINKLLGSYRFVYNQCLALKKNTYIESKTNIGLKELGNYFHQDLTKKPEYQWLNEHNTKVLKQSVINLLDSYKRFFVNGNGFPKFKSKHDNNQSCRFPVEAISRKNNYLTNRLSLTSQIKDVKFKCSDEYHNFLNEYKSGIKSATLSKTKSGKFFLSILVEHNEIKGLPKTNNVIGIDLGIKDFVITSEGEAFENIKIKRNNQKKLNKLHKQLSKKQKGSKNRNKARIKLAKYYEKLNNQKENYLHQVTNSLLNENQVIVIEDLNVNGMIKNHKLAKSIQELSLYKFKSILKYKAEWYNRDIIEIDRYFPSSKLCNVCNYKNNDLSLSDRTWKCPECGTEHDRDLNAALNIKNKGLKILSTHP